MQIEKVDLIDRTTIATSQEVKPDVFLSLCIDYRKVGDLFAQCSALEQDFSSVTEAGKTAEDIIDPNVYAKYHRAFCDYLTLIRSSYCLF